MTLDEAQNLRDEVAVYPSQFEAGLRLHVDPFIVELMEWTNALPVELSMNATRIVLFFITFCRAMSFEPTIDLLR